jgi:hypothetical protein
MVRYNLPNVVQLSFQKEVRFAGFSLQKVAACTMGINFGIEFKKCESWWTGDWGMLSWMYQAGTQEKHGPTPVERSLEVKLAIIALLFNHRSLIPSPPCIFGIVTISHATRQWPPKILSLFFHKKSRFNLSTASILAWSHSNTSHEEVWDCRENTVDHLNSTTWWHKPWHPMWQTHLNLVNYWLQELSGDLTGWQRQAQVGARQGQNGCNIVGLHFCHMPTVADPIACGSNGKLLSFTEWKKIIKFLIIFEKQNFKIFEHFLKMWTFIRSELFWTWTIF